MSTLRISKKHELDHDECRAVAEDLLDQLVAKFGGSVSEENDCLRYRHSTGMSAVIEPGERALDITVQLNMFTRSFGPKIEAQIRQVLDEHIGAE